MRCVAGWCSEVQRAGAVGDVFVRCTVLQSRDVWSIVVCCIVLQGVAVPWCVVRYSVLHGVQDVAVS